MLWLLWGKRRLPPARSLRQPAKVFTFAIVTLGLLDDNIDLSRFDDSNWR